MEIKVFICKSCDKRFEARVEKYQAPQCPHCKDSEYVEKIDYQYGYNGD
jgi:Zn finger protein HypA/HybF involved in hydrogenase expression